MAMGFNLQFYCQYSTYTMESQVWIEVSLDQGHGFHPAFLFLLHIHLCWILSVVVWRTLWTRKSDLGCPTWNIFKRLSCHSVFCALWPSRIFLTCKPFSISSWRSKNSSIQSVLLVLNPDLREPVLMSSHLQKHLVQTAAQWIHPFWYLLQVVKEHFICTKVKINIDDGVQMALLCCYKKRNVDNGCMINGPLCHSH